MILLIDAHALLWWLEDDPALTPSARAAIADPANETLVSAATIWEIEIKRATGKLRAPSELVQVIETAGLGILPILGADAVIAGQLAVHHRDPFDRMVIAQASRLDAVIVTRDGAFQAYGAQILLA